MTHEEITAEELKSAIPAAVRAGDFAAVDGLLRLLAVKDPRAAQNVLDALRIATEIRKSAL